MDPLHMKAIFDHTLSAKPEAYDAFYASHSCDWLQILKRLTRRDRKTDERHRSIRIRNA
ncbi:hypothetical protein BC777_1364 [Yoonia maricola]|uniref:Uncharacterized protein n=1 Tax=Yoonia maricola TaxID=420999 RepID=A0A2M8WNL7_9RHOB|nr:hypothetical protein BC777_1364 [Yoonia maricola]